MFHYRYVQRPIVLLTGTSAGQMSAGEELVQEVTLYQARMKSQLHFHLIWAPEPIFALKHCLTALLPG